MIKDEGRRNAILKSFPTLMPETYTEIEQDIMPHYVFYKSITKTKKECYCTHCRQWYVESKGDRAFLPISNHNDLGTCKNCGHQITYRAAGMGRGVLNGTKNVCVLRGVGDDLYISCFSVRQRFIGNEDLPEVDYTELHRYYLSKGECQHWGNKWNFKQESNTWKKVWHEMKSENEPVFDRSFTYTGERDNSYTVIGIEELDKTFLKYSQAFEYSEYKQRDDYYTKFIAYLCFYTKHPNVEYLIKTGFTDLVAARLAGESKYYINWRSNDVRKMLKLNKEEIKLLTGKGEQKLADYQVFKKVAPHLPPEECLKITNTYWVHSEHIAEIHKLTGLSLEQILNYKQKQKDKTSHHVFGDWRDYLRECKQLEYDMRDTIISKPKNLQKAHEQTSKLVKIKKDELADAKINRRVKELEKLSFANKSFTIVIPQSVKDIVDEGKELSHCVGGYAERHSKGETTILFIRQADKPSKPFYTLEYKNGIVVQCRGMKNKSMTDEVKKFVEQWEKQIKNKNLRRAV